MTQTNTRKIDVSEMDRNYYRRVFFEIAGSVDMILTYRNTWLSVFLSNNLEIQHVNHEYKSWLEAVSDILANADFSNM